MEKFKVNILDCGAVIPIGIRKIRVKWQIWRGQGGEFAALVRQAYNAMFEQSEGFRTALMATCGMTLYHTKDESNPYKTILTEQEFCSILTELRENHDHRNKTQELIAKSVQYEPEA